MDFFVILLLVIVHYEQREIANIFSIDLLHMSIL